MYLFKTAVLAKLMQYRQFKEETQGVEHPAILAAINIVTASTDDPFLSDEEEVALMRCFFENPVSPDSLAAGIWKELFADLKPVLLIAGSQYLFDLKLLNVENYIAIKSAVNPRQHAAGLAMLEKAKILTSENREALDHNPSPHGVAYGFALLTKYSVLTPLSRNEILEAQRPEQQAKYLIEREQQSLIAQAGVKRDRVEEAEPTQVSAAIKYYREDRSEPRFFQSTPLPLLATKDMNDINENSFALAGDEQVASVATNVYK